MWFLKNTLTVVEVLEDAMRNEKKKKKVETYPNFSNVLNTEKTLDIVVTIDRYVN